MYYLFSNPRSLEQQGLIIESIEYSHLSNIRGDWNKHGGVKVEVEGKLVKYHSTNNFKIKIHTTSTILKSMLFCPSVCPFF